MLLGWGICQNEDPKSVVFVGLLHNFLKIFPHKGRMHFWLTNWHLGTKAVSGVWRSLVTCGDVCSDVTEVHGLNPCGQGDEEDAGGFTKTFPDIPRVSLMSGGLWLRLSIPHRTA